MKMVQSARLFRSAFEKVIEALESRRLLSATLVSAVPTQSVPVGSTGTTVNLATYLDDPALTGGTVVEMQTPLGNIPLELTDTTTPLTVANFLQYITDGEYVPTIIQRSAPGFVLQGGGTKPDGSSNTPLADVASESGISNTTGTIAMALSSGPASANNQWFINLGDNASTLDGSSDGGPFTVFGNVIDGGMTIANNIAALQIINGSAENSNWYIGSDDGLPVINYNGSSTPTTVPEANLVTDTVVKLAGTAAEATYSAVSANPALITASVVNNVLTLAPVAGAMAGSTTVTATVTDLSGETASSTFVVNVAGLPTVTIANASTAADSSADVVFPVTLSSASSSALTLDYTLTSGTAPASDYEAPGSSLIIPAGSTNVSIPVSVLMDSTGTSENFTITLSNISSGATFAGGTSTETATGIISPAGSTSFATTTALTVSSSAVGAGATDTFVAVVTPSVSGTAPTGTVSFALNGSLYGSAAVIGGTATLTNLLNTPGTQTIVATYSGNGTEGTSTSNAVTVNVSTLTPTIVRNTLPTAVVTGTPVRGSLVLAAMNTSADIEQGTATFDLYASTDGEIDGNSVLIASVPKSIKLLAGKSITVPIPIKSFASTLVPGIYTLLTQITDPSENTSDSTSGPTVTVAAPNLSLTESVTRLALPGAVVAGSKTSVAAQVRITNVGNVASIGETTIALLASVDGTFVAGTPVKSIARKLSIAVGKSVLVTVPLGAYPIVADGNYVIVAHVTDPNGGSSSAEFSTPVNIAAAKIDLVNAIIAVSATGIIGKTIFVTLDVTNNGNVSASGTLEVAFSASLSSDGSSAVSLASVPTPINLKPSRSRIVRLRVALPAGSPTGQIYLVSILDPANLFNDVDLSNNRSVSSTFITVN